MKIIFLVLLACVAAHAASWAPTQCGPGNLMTQWGKQVDPNNVLPEYPRPQLVRPEYTYQNLNGIWEFQPGNPNDQPPFGQTLSSIILVPFPVESCLSGVGKNYQYLWYRLVFDMPTTFNNTNTILRFGAVDWQATVWVNKQLFGQHTGGYNGFEFDITKNLTKTNNELLVFVYDPSDEGVQPNGKQRISAITDPGGDTYTPSSGIWQTVWLENVPATHITAIKLTPTLSSITITTTLSPGTQPEPGVDYPGGDLTSSPLTPIDLYDCASKCTSTSGCIAWSYGPPGCDGVGNPRCWLKSNITTRAENPCRVYSKVGPTQNVKYTVLDGDTVVATGSGNTGSPVTINIPSPKLWSFTSPFLYNLIIQTNNEKVTSYFGLRIVSLGNFNHAPIPATGPQQNVDRPGDDLPNMPFALSSADPNLCWERCNQTQGCLAWAYGAPNCGGGSNQPLCWLKSSFPGTSDNNCRVSGAQGVDAFVAARPLINNNYSFLAGWLDQSFWPDGQYTAPTDEALAFDLQALKTFGFNVVRLHQKVNSERWYWYADTLGIIVIQDMIQKYGGATQATVPYFISDIQSMIINKYNHPSIIQWTVFNEEDCVGQFNVSNTVNIASSLDPTRLYDTNSGGPANSLGLADVNDLHTYPYPGDPLPSKTQYGMLGEFGGVGAYVAGKEWVPNQCGTYLPVPTPSDEATTYIQMVQTIMSKNTDISVSIYTQICDVERECDGFLNYDRTNKFDDSTTAKIAAANIALINSLSQ